MNLLTRLECFKQLGMSAVRLSYGEDIGELDITVPYMERVVHLQAAPNGYHNKVKVVWVGPVHRLLAFDFHANKPEVLSHPLMDNDMMRAEMGGWFIFGAPQDVHAVLEQYGKQVITG